MYKLKITCNCKEINFQLRANFRAVTGRMRYTTQAQEGGVGRWTLRGWRTGRWVCELHSDFLTKMTS